MDHSKEIVCVLTSHSGKIAQLTKEGYFPVNDTPFEPGFLRADTAYESEDSYGSLRENPRIVVRGTKVTPHVCMLIACLLGLVPRSSGKEYKKLIKLISEAHEYPDKGIIPAPSMSPEVVEQYPLNREVNLLLLWEHRWCELGKKAELVDGVKLWQAITHCDDEEAQSREAKAARDEYDVEAKVIYFHLELKHARNALKLAVPSSMSPAQVEKYTKLAINVGRLEYALKDAAHAVKKR